MVYRRDDLRLLQVLGPDARSFLGGLITQATDLAVGQGAYSALLTPQGKLLADFPLMSVGVQELVLGLKKEIFDETLKKLRLFKLRSDVQLMEISDQILISKFDASQPDSSEFSACESEAFELNVPDSEAPDSEASNSEAPDTSGVSDSSKSESCDSSDFSSSDSDDSGTSNCKISEPDESPLAFADGRWAGLSHGLAASTVQGGTPDAFHRARAQRGIPEGAYDLIPGKSTLLDEGLACAIDWQKGCYMGQEVTARMRYRALIKRILVPYQGQASVGQSLEIAGKKIGEVRSTYGNHGFAYVRKEAADQVIDGLHLGGPIGLGQFNL